MLAPERPFKLDVVIVNNSGTDVEIPAIFPTVFAFKFKFFFSCYN